MIPLQCYEYIQMLLDPASEAIPMSVKICLFCYFELVHSMFIHWFIGIVRKIGNQFVASHKVEKTN